MVMARATSRRQPRSEIGLRLYVARGSALIFEETEQQPSPRTLCHRRRKSMKLDAAERKLVAAVRGFLKDEDAIVAYSLAGDAARSWVRWSASASGI
jgi:hypothetical protein